MFNQHMMARKNVVGGPEKGPPAGPVAEWYSEFAAREARGVSPVYERLSLAVAADDELLALLEHVAAGQTAAEPAVRRRAVARRPGAATRPRSRARTRRTGRPSSAELRTRATQTNEAGRCAVLLPVLAGAAAAAGAAGGRRVRRPVPLPRPVRLPVRRPPARRRAPRSWTARRPVVPPPALPPGGVAGRAGPEPAGRDRPRRRRVAGRADLAGAHAPPGPAARGGRRSPPPTRRCWSAATWWTTCRRWPRRLRQMRLWSCSHLGAVPGAAATPDGVRRAGERAARALGRQRVAGTCCRYDALPPPPDDALHNVLAARRRRRWPGPAATVRR